MNQATLNVRPESIIELISLNTLELSDKIVPSISLGSEFQSFQIVVESPKPINSNSESSPSKNLFAVSPITALQNPNINFSEACKNVLKEEIANGLILPNNIEEEDEDDEVGRFLTPNFEGINLVEKTPDFHPKVETVEWDLISSVNVAPIEKDKSSSVIDDISNTEKGNKSPVIEDISNIEKETPSGDPFSLDFPTLFEFSITKQNIQESNDLSNEEKKQDDLVSEYPSLIGLNITNLAANEDSLQIKNSENNIKNPNEDSLRIMNDIQNEYESTKDYNKIEEEKVRVLVIENFLGAENDSKRIKTNSLSKKNNLISEEANISIVSCNKKIKRNNSDGVKKIRSSHLNPNLKAKKKIKIDASKLDLRTVNQKRASLKPTASSSNFKSSSLVFKNSKIKKIQTKSVSPAKLPKIKDSSKKDFMNELNSPYYPKSNQDILKNMFKIRLTFLDSDKKILVTRLRKKRIIAKQENK